MFIAGDRRFPAASADATSAELLRDIEPLVKQAEKELPRGSYIVMRGQAETMKSSFIGLGIGLVMAIALVLFAIGREFPKLARSVHHHHGAPGRVGGSGVGALSDDDDLERSGADGRHYEHGRGDVQFRAGRQFCAFESSAWNRSADGRLGGRHWPSAARDHDGPGDGDRHVAR